MSEAALLLASGDPKVLQSAFSEIEGFLRAQDWKDHDVGSALTAYRLLFPTLVNYRGGWFRADRFSPHNADEWFAQPEATVAGVEFMVNHIDLLEDDPRGDDAPDEAANALAAALAFAWPVWFKAFYGIDVEIRVHMHDDESTCARTISFFTKASA